MTQLRPYQLDAIIETRLALMAGARRIVLQLPTGAGKTIIAAEIIASARTKGKRVIFVVPAKALVDQTVQRFWEHGIRDVGVMQADHVMTDSTKPVQVATVQTLRRRAKPEVDLVLVDEAHLQDKALLGWLKSPEMASVRVVGLTATPWTAGMGNFWQKLLIGSTTAKMIEAGYLSPFRVFAPSHPDLTGVRTKAGEFHEGDLSKAMDKPVLIADVVESWVRLAENRPTLCFAVDRAHAKSLRHQCRLRRCLHVGTGSQRYRGKVPCGDLQGRAECRCSDDGRRLGRPLHQPMPPDQKRKPVRPDRRSWPSHGRGQDGLPDFGPLR